MPLTPKQSSDDALARARAIHACSQSAAIPRGTKNDLIRMSLTMGIAALDSYLHTAVMSNLASWDMPTTVANLDLKLDEVCSVVQQTTADRRKSAHSRPWVRVKDAIRLRLLKESFQSSRAVEKAMLMCRVRNGWHKVAVALNEDKDELKQELDRIVYRRNQIVHECDLTRQARPQRITRNSIDATEVHNQLDWLEQLIDGIDSVIG